MQSSANKLCLLAIDVAYVVFHVLISFIQSLCLKEARTLGNEKLSKHRVRKLQFLEWIHDAGSKSDSISIRSHVKTANL